MRNSTTESAVQLSQAESRSEDMLDVFDALLAEAERTVKLRALQSQADRAGAGAKAPPTSSRSA